MDYDYKDEEKAGWSAALPYYNHLKQLWDAEAEARFRLNDAKDYRSLAIALENWFEAVDVLAGRIVPFLSITEAEQLNSKYDEITAKTGNSGWHSIGLDGDTLTETQVLIREYSRLCFSGMARYNMLLPTVRARNVKAVF